MRFDLARMGAVLSVLKHPEHGFVSVHVAGTNGKGSVCAFLERVFREAGYRTALYTSPHLERITERFRVNGREISQADLSRCLSLVRSALASPELRQHPAFGKKSPELTQFEVLTLIAFLWFAEKKPDIAIIETGLGGRLDATNVLRRVAASVITTIGLDHTDWLGKTEAAIAAEKAGIIKPGVPVVTGAQGTALRVIEKRAREKKASLRKVTGLSSLPVGLPGEHQRRNARIAEATVRELRLRGFTVPEGAVRRGLARAEWPGRFERFLLRRGKTRIPVILDGAHNTDGMRALVQGLKKNRLVPVDALFGALRDKDTHGMSRMLAPVVERCVTTAVPSDRSEKAATLARLPIWRGKAKPGTSVKAGWRGLVKTNTGRPLVVAGSLYLVGAVRTMLRRDPNILRDGREL